MLKSDNLGLGSSSVAVSNLFSSCTTGISACPSSTSVSLAI